MADSVERYINPFTDFGFKRLFGEELNKGMLLDFLNELLRDQEGRILDLTYLKNEQLDRESTRRAIFDVYCTSEHGDRFIVELQKTRQNFFKDRTIYYSTFPIRDQAKRRDWNYELRAVYTISILDFIFDRGNPKEYRHDIVLMNKKTGKVFYSKLMYVYLEMPKFRKAVGELEDRFEKWLYVIRNLSRLDGVPSGLGEEVFERFFSLAEIAKFNQEEFRNYEDSLKHYRDMKNTLDTARGEGIEQGKEEGRKEGKEEGRKEGKEEGRKEGKEEGRKEGKEEGRKEEKEQMISKAIKQGILTVEQIADMVEVTPKQVLELKAKMERNTR